MPLKAVKEIFDKLKFHHVLAVESNKLYGVVSDRDLSKTLSPNIGTMAEAIKDTSMLNKKARVLYDQQAGYVSI